MRLWHKDLIPALPDKMLVSQWRELIAIKRQWEKGTLKHRLVSYIQNYSKLYFLNYILAVKKELDNRHIKYSRKLFLELYDFCSEPFWMDKKEIDVFYPEHNDRYKRQCFYNLQEKYDRGIISPLEWRRLEDYER